MRGDHQLPRLARRHPVISTIAGLALLGLGALGFVNSALFRIEKIRVVGNRHLTDWQVIDIAGVTPGRNLLFVGTGEVERALTRDRWVRAADASRSLPSTLVIRVVERSPVAWVEDGRGYAVLAEDATVLERTEDPPADLVHVGAVPASLVPGDVVGDLVPALRVLGAVPPVVREEVSSAEALGEEVVLHLHSGSRVLYGEAQGFREKNGVLEAMMRWVGERAMAVEYYDVRAPANPSLKPLGAPAAGPELPPRG